MYTAMLKQLETRLGALVPSNCPVFCVSFSDVYGIWRVNSLKEVSRFPVDYSKWGSAHNFVLKSVEISAENMRVLDTDGGHRTYDLQPDGTQLVVEMARDEDNRQVRVTTLEVKLHKTVGKMSTFRISRVRTDLHAIVKLTGSSIIEYELVKQ